jgi:hypothetical protein
MRIKLTEELIEELDLLQTKREDLPLQYKHLGMCASIEGVNAETGQRATMGPPAISRAMPLLNPEPTLVETGMSAITADYTFKTTIPATGIVLLKQVKSDYETTIVISGSDGKLYNVDVNTFVKTHEKYGFPMIYTDYFLNLTIGDSVVEGTLLSYSPQNETGLETNTANLVGLAGYFNQTSEDSIVVSRSATKKLETITYHERILDIKKDDLLINLYGDADNYQPIPLVGQYIREDLALIGKRSMSNIMLAPALLSNDSLMEYDEAFDTIKYGPDKHCKVLSVEVINTEGNQPNRFPFTVQKLYEISETQKNEHQQFINTYVNNGFRPCSPKMTLDLAYSNSILNVKRLKYKIAKLNNLRVKIVLEERIIPDIKSKLSGKYGNKGIICDVVEDHLMPITEDGIRVDYIYEAGSVLNRNNSPVTTIGGLGMQCKLLHYRIKKMYGLEKDEYINFNDFVNVSDDVHNSVCELMLKFYELALSPLYETYKISFQNNIERNDILFDTVINGFRTILPGPHMSGIIPMERLKDSEFKLPKVKIKNMLTESGQNVTFKDEMSLTVQAILVQNKLGDRIMATNTPFENHYELPTSLGSSDRDNRQLNYSAIKLVGNTEKRTLEAHVETEALAEFVEMGKDPLVRNYAYGTLLRQDTFPIKAVDRKLIKFNNDPFTRMFESVTQCMGFLPESFESGYEEEDKFEDEVTEEKWIYDQKL